MEGLRLALILGLIEALGLTLGLTEALILAEMDGLIDASPKTMESRAKNTHGSPSASLSAALRSPFTSLSPIMAVLS
jgi:hypothetical protein